MDTLGAKIVQFKAQYNETDSNQQTMEARLKKLKEKLIELERKKEGEDLLNVEKIKEIPNPDSAKNSDEEEFKAAENDEIEAGEQNDIGKLSEIPQPEDQESIANKEKEEEDPFTFQEGDEPTKTCVELMNTLRGLQDSLNKLRERQRFLENKLAFQEKQATK